MLRGAWMSGLFGIYERADAFDEMIADDGRIRARFGPVAEIFGRLSRHDIQLRVESVSRSYLDQGVTFDFAGEERPFPLDIVPRVIKEDEWQLIESGVVQRVSALEAFLEDLYHGQDCIKDGVIPARLPLSCPDFRRIAFAIQPHNGVRIHVAGIDIVRADDGSFRVLEDNVRVPSGVSYVLSNRRAMVQTFPELFSRMRIRSVEDYPRNLLQALANAAPGGMQEPTIVVLTPGVFNSAYYEHSLLARLMGVELVEGRDLFCRGGYVYMRTTAGSRRVDVIYRRMDDEWLDPVKFRFDSLLGVPGILDCARRGRVVLANAIGNGVADDKLTYTYVPDLIRYYLREEPIIGNIPTWRLEDAQAREEVFDRIGELVVKPVNGSGGKGIVIGPSASQQQLDELRQRVGADPRGWIAQPVVKLSTSPTWVDGGFGPRHVDLRPFAVNNGEQIKLIPGGLTRVALPKGQLIVNSSQGGGSKDTWVLGVDTRRDSITSLVQRAARKSGSVISYHSARPVPMMVNPRDDESENYGQQQQQQQSRPGDEGRPDANRGGASCSAG